jgi:hypothetical protein
MNSVLERWLDSRWMEALLLLRAERTATSYPTGRAAAMRRLFTGAEARNRAAGELVRTMPVASLPLYRDAALLYMAAACSVRTEAPFDEPLDGERVVRSFLELGRDKPLTAPRDEVADFFRFVARPDPSWLDRQPRREVQRKLQSLQKMNEWLRGFVEPRSREHIRAERAAKICALLAIVLGFVAWKARVAIRAKDIALEKPVTMSSIYPTASFPAGGLTDGFVSDTYGVHTNREALPWVQIDLGEVFRIDKIDVYNRSDCCFDDGLPMTLLLSENGQEFVTVDSRRQSFTAASPWTYFAQGHRARYIRINGAPGSYLALGEVEAFGKK